MSLIKNVCFTLKQKFILTSLVLCTLGSNVSASEELEGEQVPTDFVRDVLQPMGVPVVSFYHHIRGNLFLNTKCENTHLFESIGNFFLTPSRYLFAGKKILIQNDADLFSCKLVQEYSYDSFHGLNALGALMLLPTCEVFGVLFKSIAYLSSEVRTRHQKIQKHLTTPPSRDQLNKRIFKKHSDFYSNKLMKSQGYKRPSHLTKKQKIEIQALKDITTLLDAHGIIYWIDWGTCLGAYRYGGIIPWDWDIDISILEDDHDNVKKILSSLDPKKYKTQDWSSYSKPKSFIKVYIEETKNFLDIFHYKFNEQNKTIEYIFTYIDSPFPESWKKNEIRSITPLKYEEIFPLKLARFDNLIVKVPRNVLALLHTKYGENLEPTMIWDETTKTYQKVQDHPYYQE